MDKLFITVGRTLIDITNTGIVAHNSSKERNQNRNWETTKQVLGLRTQLILLTSPVIHIIDITDTEFGSSYSGQHKVWEFKFGVEFEAIFSSSTGPYGTLELDFVNVPIILNLDETVAIAYPTFNASGPNKNIYFFAFEI